MKLPYSLKPGHGNILAATPFILCSLFASFIDSQTIVLALPTIQDKYNLSKTTAQWLMTINYLATAAFAIPLGRLGDRYGYVIIISTLLVLNGLCQVGFYFAYNFVVMLCIRFAVGICSSGIISNKNIINRILPEHEKQQNFLQKSQILVQFTGLVTPLICGTLIQYTEYKYCFLISGCLSFISVILVVFFTNPTQNKGKVRNDIIGSLLIMVTVGLFCVTFTLLSQKYYWQSALTFVLSIGLSVLFYFVEKRHSNPIIPIQLLKNPVTDIVLINISSYIINSALGYILPQFLALKNIKATFVSLIYTIAGFLTFIFSIIIPIIQKRFLNRDILVVLHCFSIVATVILFFVTNYLIGVMVMFVVLQLCIQCSQLIIYPLTMMSVPKKYSGQIAAIPTTGRTVGQSISYCLFSMIHALIVENTKIADEVEKQIFGYQISFILFLPFILFNIFIIWFRIGLQENEGIKKGFKQSKVRKLQEVEDDQLIPDEVTDSFQQGDFVSESNRQFQIAIQK